MYTYNEQRKIVIPTQSSGLELNYNNPIMTYPGYTIITYLSEKSCFYKVIISFYQLHTDTGIQQSIQL